PVASPSPRGAGWPGWACSRSCGWSEARPRSRTTRRCGISSACSTRSTGGRRRLARPARPPTQRTARRSSRRSPSWNAATRPRRARAGGRELAAGAARRLPPRAAERLAHVRAAYESGQGRLVLLLRSLSGRRGTASALGAADQGALQEASDIARRLLEASRQEPLSGGELKLRSPSLTPPPLASTAAAEPPAFVAETAVGPIPQ